MQDLPKALLVLLGEGADFSWVCMGSGLHGPHFRIAAGWSEGSLLQAARRLGSPCVVLTVQEAAHPFMVEPRLAVTS